MDLFQLGIAITEFFFAGLIYFLGVALWVAGEDDWENGGRVSAIILGGIATILMYFGIISFL